MDTYLAVVRLHTPRKPSSNTFLSPIDYDILLSTSTSGSGNVGLDPDGPSTSESALSFDYTLSLPACRSGNEDCVDAASDFVRKRLSVTPRRAVSIPMWQTSSSGPPFVCVPIGADSVTDLPAHGLEGQGLAFFNLSNVLSWALNDHASLNVRSRHLVVRLEEWLSHGQHSCAQFLHRLFELASAEARIRAGVLNPAYGEHLSRSQSGGSRSGELAVAVKNRNIIMAKMLEMDKFDKYHLNPLFGSGLTPAKRHQSVPEYYARGRKLLVSKNRQPISPSSPTSEKSPTEFWGQQHPLHKAAFEGDHLRVQELLDKGYNPNELDNDFWTPLHYCAFYNRFEVCGVLMTHSKANVNAVNRTGSTALHFAALNGHLYLVELILSHQLVDVNIKDSSGRTALELCERVPKPDWQDAAFLLRNHQLRPRKIEVQLAGGPTLQVEVGNVVAATAEELKDKVLEHEGLGATAARIFAVWIVSSRLSLQLKAEQKIKVQLDKWAEHLDKWGDQRPPDGPPSVPVRLVEEDRACIMLKRDARTLLGDEQLIARKNPEVISLLYAEAEQNFLNGLYPCSEKCYTQLAAIILQRLYGSHDESFVIDASVLANILPRHLRPANNADSKAASALIQKLGLAHRSLPTRNLVQLQLLFLKLCWTLNVYGCTFFKAFMLMSKPLRGNIHVHVGINDWGMSVINSHSRRQISAIELKNLEMKYAPNTNYVEADSRKRDFAATFTTPQAMLVNNLTKQLKAKVQSSSLPSTLSTKAKATSSTSS